MLKNNEKSLQEKTASLFVRVYQRLNAPLDNRTKALLGTDLLRYEVKQYLFKRVTLSTEEAFLDLIKTGQTSVSSSESKVIFLKIISISTEIFLTRYYGIKIKIDDTMVLRIPAVQAICNDSDMLLSVLFSSLLNPKAPIFRSTFLPIYKSVNISLQDALFDNLIIAMTNGIMAVIINEFLLVSDIRQNLYKSNFLSIRNIEQFKNKLAWQSQVQRYIARPKNLYNSEYEIFVIRADGIYSRSIYANRIDELLTLNNFSLFFINYIELQDIVVAKSNSAILLIGKSTQYFFTSIIGRVIGLIWKGVIDGLK
jgi:hypothetical protein